MADATKGPLGPGDEDPRSPAGVTVSTATAPAGGPLGPGDDDPKSPPSVSESTARAPLGPGDDDPDSPPDLRVPLPPMTPAGPGDAATSPRFVTHLDVPAEFDVNATAAPSAPVVESSAPADPADEDKE